MRAAIVVIALALPFCPGCFTIMGAAIAAAGGGSSALGTGAQLDADIARGVAEGIMSGSGSEARAPIGPEGRPVYAMADAYLCTIPGSAGDEEDTEVIEARSLASALDVCEAENDLDDDGACVCHAIREPVPSDT